MNEDNLNDLLMTAKKQLDKANGMIQALNANHLKLQNQGVKDGLEAIQTYIKNADIIISWLRG